MKKILPLIVLSLFILSSSGTPVAPKKKLLGLNSPSTTIELMRMNIYDKNPDGSSFWIDGTVTQYGADYSDDIDGEDGRKMTNPGANVCLLRDNINLVVERRQIIEGSDTIFFKIWGLQKKTYEMMFVALNLEQPGLKAYLEDNYLHTSTPVQLDDTTRVNIDINDDAASYATDRFRLIYKSETTVAPVVHFTSINAFPGEGRILLNWATENQNSIKQYFVEKSSDGVHFINIVAVDSKYFSGGKYEWTDHFPASEYRYYRVKSIDLKGTSTFSDIVKVKEPPVETQKEIRVFPNPASAGNCNLDMTNQPEGNYQVWIYNSSGILLNRQTFNKVAGVNKVKLSINQTILPGIYHLEIIKPSAEKVFINVIF
jgi:hypothetical protein